MDIGIPELLIILVIVVLFFGTGRLVNVGKELGQGIREFRQGLKEPESKAEPGEEAKVEEKEDATDK
jgi:sec-independent protein translocase protein TatA